MCGADLQNTQIQFTGETGFVYSVRSCFKPFCNFVLFLLVCVFKFVWLKLRLEWLKLAISAQEWLCLKVCRLI